ncbi:MAG: 30S ribosomal protein S13 [Candidatus Margulisiibacteriota bacterium]|jgi:small subunit ribosomal protein S13
MVRLVGVDLPANKRIDIALTYIYGVGNSLAKKVLAAARIEPEVRVKDLNDQEVVAMRNALKDYQIEGDLRKDISLSIKRLVDIGTYRGTRHRKGLPARGQRSKTNARTKRGMRKTVGLGKRKEEKT